MKLRQSLAVGLEAFAANALPCDPVEGIVHSRATRDRHSFVFDMMEPLRPVVGWAVLNLVCEESFSGADCILQDDGVCRLGPELARQLVHEVAAILTEHFKVAGQ